MLSDRAKSLPDITKPGWWMPTEEAPLGYGLIGPITAMDIMYPFCSLNWGHYGMGHRKRIEDGTDDQYLNDSIERMGKRLEDK